MRNDPQEALLGTTRSSVKEVSNHAGTINAGLAVRLKSDDTLSVASADGSLLGISLGKSLSDTARTAICRKGLMVPVLLGDAFSPVIGAVVSINNTTGKAVASGGGATAVNAVYATGKLTTGGIAEDATTGLAVAYIDFPGGL